MKKMFLLFVFILLLISGFAYSATIWYIPEGCTRGFDLWILVTNPNSSSASIKYTFFTANNGTLTHTETVAANSRLSIYANAKINAASGSTIEDDVSTKVECTNGLNIYAERAMYWPSVGAGGGVDGAWTGGHSARAISGIEGCYNEIAQPSSFPITISTSGSYKLTGNLTCTTENVNAIEITASNVTLDLNGFVITGPGFGSTSGAGIYIYNSDVGAYYINVLNGTIGNFADYGIYALDGGDFYFTNLKICENGTNGIKLENVSNSVIEKCQLYLNSTYGIHVAATTNSVIRDNVCNGSTIPLRATDSSTYNRIEGNHCIGDGVTDIYCDATSTNNLLIENTYKNAVSISAGNVTSMTNQGNVDLN